MKTRAVPASEAAYILRRNLGPIKAWDDFLADNRRERQNLNGLTLPSCGKVRDRARRPIYDVRDIAKFIADAKAMGLAMPEPEKIKSIEVDLDPEIPWFLRIFDRDGKPVTPTEH